MSDVAIKPKSGEPQKFANIVCSSMPTGVSMGKYNETKDDNMAISPSGLLSRLDNRFDDRTYYSN